MAITVAQFKREIESWTKQILSPYLEELKSPSYNVPSQGRDFNDAVWGAISATPFEAILVDSPLFQRLRHVKQLGVIHLIYPSCHHTRFEHSLGVLHVVQLIVDSLNRPENVSAALISSRNQIIVRAAALCHDWGHCAFSHVSESYLLHFADIVELCLDFSEHYGVEDLQFSEIIAIAILEAKPTRALFEIACNKTHLGISSVDLVDSIINCLLGKPFCEKAPLLSEIISGPFDADKLDYMRRDSQMAGIPSLIDVVRLIKKIRGEKFRATDLSAFPTVAKLAHGNDILIAAIAQSGSRALDELLIGRILLVDKLYRHQRVRSFEGIVFHLLDAHYIATSSDQVDQVRSRYLPTLEKSDSDYLSPSEKQGPKWDEFHCLQERFRNRCGYVKVFALSKTFKDLDPEQQAGIERFFDSIEKVRKITFFHDLAVLIEAAAKLLGGSIKKNVDRDPLPLRRRIWIDPQDGRKHSNKVDRAWIISSSRNLTRYEKVSVEAPQWANSYLQRKDVAYLFADSEIAPVTHLAFELMLGKRFKINPDIPQQDFIKIRDLTNLRGKLVEKGYFKGVEYRHRVQPAAVQNLLNGGKIRSVLERLQGYNIPPSAQQHASITSTSVTETTIADWLSQFETEALIESAFLCLENILFIGRELIFKTIENFRSTHSGYDNASLVALGSPEDGASLVTYLGKDSGLPVKDVSEAIEDGNPIIFLDDFVGLGNTCDNILSGLFGLKPKRNLKQKKLKRLTHEQAGKLRNLRCAVVFSAGWSKGETLTKEVFRRIGVDWDFYIEKRDNQIPSVSSVLQGNRLAAFCRKAREIGISLNSSKRWSVADKKGRALGYGNQGLLVVTPVNTPTQTLTCLWRNGRYNGLEWQAALPRREKGL